MDTTDRKIKFFAIKLQFFSMVLVKDVEFRDSEGNFLFETPKHQADLLDMTVKNALCQHFPPSLSYQQFFVKSILKKCEENNFEICDELYEVYAKLIGRSCEVKDVCYKTYFLKPKEYITLEESTQLISHGTTGLCTWQAAKYLAEWAIENKTIFEKKHVLELGSGLGLTGVAVCKFCSPASYTFTDCHDYVLRAVKRNVEINCWHGDDVGGCRQARTCFKKLDWEDVTESDLKSLGSEVILASDVVYDDRLLDPLVEVLLHLLLSSSVTSPVAYIASTIRNETTFKKFIDVLDKKSICWDEVTDTPMQLFHYNKDVCIKLLKLTYK